MKIGAPTNTPELLMHVKEDENTKRMYDASPLDLISAVHYKPTENREFQIRRQDTVRETNPERKTNHWKVSLKISMKFDKYKPEIIEILSEFQKM